MVSIRNGRNLSMSYWEPDIIFTYCVKVCESSPQFSVLKVVLKSLLIDGFEWPNEVSSSWRLKYKQKLPSSCHFHVSRCSILKRSHNREQFGTLFETWEEIFSRYSTSVFRYTFFTELNAVSSSRYILKISESSFFLHSPEGIWE